jgi:hypothetical protein
MKPGQEIKTAKRELEEQLLKLFREFNENNGCQIQNIYPMYDHMVGGEVPDIVWVKIDVSL